MNKPLTERQRQFLDAAWELYIETGRQPVALARLAERFGRRASTARNQLVICRRKGHQLPPLRHQPGPTVRPELTARQRQVFKVVWDRYQATERPLVRTELARLCGVTPTTISYMYDQIRRKGHEVPPLRTRSRQLVRSAEPKTPGPNPEDRLTRAEIDRRKRVVKQVKLDWLASGRSIMDPAYHDALDAAIGEPSPERKRQARKQQLRQEARRAQHVA